MEQSINKIFIKKLNEDNFSYFAFRGETPPTEDEYIEATQEVLDGLSKRKLRWNGNEIVDNAEGDKPPANRWITPNRELAILKAKLRSSNDKAIAFSAGEITAEEFAPIKEQRNTWRERIAELELLLENKEKAK